MHRLNIKPDAKLVKQQQRQFRPDIMEAIETEVHKLTECSFIREEQHPDWVANIVPVLKKNGKIIVCIDFRDLNTDCPKDKFSMLITDVMIDNTCGFRKDVLYGWLFRADDEKHTSFKNAIGGIQLYNNIVRIEKVQLTNMP